MTMRILGGIRSADGGRPSASDSSRSGAVTGQSGHNRYLYLIAVVEELDETVTLDRVVDVMVRWEYDGDLGSPQRTWHDVHEELYLVDLPVLDEAGYVEFDAERGLVVPASS